MNRKIDRLYFELTTMCNLKCKHCFNFNEDVKPKHLDFETFSTFYKKIKNKTQGIVLTGGEPFLHPQIIKILDLLSQENVVITTNAALYNESYYEKIMMEYPNVFLQISFDGMTKETFETVRGLGSYEKVKRVIDYLSRQGYAQRLGLSVSILACNIGEVPDIVRYAQEQKLHSIHFPTLIIEGRCAEDMTLLPEVKDLNQTEDQLLILAAESQDINISVNTLSRLAGWVHRKGEMDCLSNATMKVTADGNIMPCPVAWKKEESLGMIEQISCFGDIVSLLNGVQCEKQHSDECRECQAEGLCSMSFCEYCHIRKTNILQGKQYRCLNLKHHFNNIMKEEV